MIVEYPTGTVHRRVAWDADPRLARTACGRRLDVRPPRPVVLCPCDYHKAILKPVLPSNQTGCADCFPDGGWHPVAVAFERPPMPWPSTLVDGS